MGNKKKNYCHKTTKRIRDTGEETLRSHYEIRALSSTPHPTFFVFFPLVSRNGDSKYPSCPQRFLPDQRHHNGGPDEEHMQLLSLNKISKFQLYPSTMATALVCWLSSYSVGLLIASSPLPCEVLRGFPSPSSIHTTPFNFFGFISSSQRCHHPQSIQSIWII